MNINMPFGIDKNQDWYSIEKEARDGVWPLSYNGVWHTGIHFKAKDRYSLLRPFIPGKIVASRICEKYEDSPFGNKYSNSFVLMKHFFGSKKIPFYILYSGLASKEVIEGYQEIEKDGKKFKKYNEFISYKNYDGNEIYRPLFCRSWTLKSESIDKLLETESHVPAFYKNNVVAGYFNRDGRYIFIKTPKEIKFKGFDNVKYDVLMDKENPKGFSKIDENKYFSELNEVNKKKFDHNPETSNNKIKKQTGVWLTVYYDNNYSYNLKKFKINIEKLKNKTFISSNNYYSFASEAEIEPLYKKESFYILVNTKLNSNESITFFEDNRFEKDGQNIFVNDYSNLKFELKNTRVYNKTIKIYSKTKNSDSISNKCFKGDKLKILEEFNCDDNKLYQYKVQKISISNDGYINSSKYDCSSLISYEIQNNKYKQNNDFPLAQNMVKLYDEPGKESNGITIYPLSCINKNEIFEILKKNNDYYALIKINKDTSSIKYINPVLINDETGNYFYGYIKLNKDKIENENFLNCVEPSFKVGFNKFNTIVTDCSKELQEEYDGPIAIFDTNFIENEEAVNEKKQNPFELHVELFTTNMKDFEFNQKKKTKNQDEDVLLEIFNNNNLKVATNQILIKNANLYSEDTINKYYTIEKKLNGLNSLWIKRYRKIFFYIDKEKIVIEKTRLKAKINKDKDKNIVNFIPSNNYNFSNYKFVKKNKYLCTFVPDDNQYYCLVEIENKQTDYFILYNDIGNTSSENTKELSNETPIYTDNQIKLENINEKVYTKNKVIAYKNVSFLNIIDGGIPKDYIRVNFNDKFYFLEEKNIDDFQIEKQFEEIDESSKNDESSKRYNVFSLPGFVLLEDTNDDYICDLSILSEKTKLNISENAKEQNIADLIYNDNDQNSSLYEQLSRLVIKAPSIWEEPENWDSVKKSYIENIGYWGIPKSSLDSLYEYIKNQFFIISSGGNSNKNKIFTEECEKNISNNYYFFHPLRFLQYYTEKTIQEFNPYVGKVLIDLPSESMGGINIVMNNPGFAPNYASNCGQYKCFVTNEGKELVFSSSSGFFNENYLPVGGYRKTYREFYHEGIDFRGIWPPYYKGESKEKGSKIYSFIFCEVKAFGWSNYGKTVILKKDNNYYLLAHLSDFNNLSVGQKIAPGDVVGYVGASGNNKSLKAWAPHLHISYYYVNPSDKKIRDVLTEAINDLEAFEDQTKKKKYLRNPIYRQGERNENA